MKKTRVLIIGSGPAGMAAALYTARAQLQPIVLVGKQLGGQAAITHEIENYPGFVEAISGPDLIERMKGQAERFGASFVWDEVTSVDFTSGTPYTVQAHNETYRADTVIVAIGADPRKLGVPGEAEYTGYGVSYCGTCDGFFFRNMDIVVVGGGDSALEEALFLTKFATSVTVVHRRDTLRAGVQLQTRALKHPKLRFVYNTAVDAIHADAQGRVNGVTLKDLINGETRPHPTQGVFIFIGHTPNSALFGDQLATDAAGYMITDDLYRTSVDGVFAAGEIQDPYWRQVATSVGQGTAAAMSSIHWLGAREDQLQPLDELTADQMPGITLNPESY